MEVPTNKQKEEVCVHVISQTESNPFDEDPHNFRFDIAPFRQTFFRYSMYGLSEVVRSTSVVYASHHVSENTWLDIPKISVSLVGSNETPNLSLFAPTVKEVYFMGHITYPLSAFRMLTQLPSLKTVVFNFGLGGHSCEFHETPEEFLNPTPAIPEVTSLDIKINHQLYNNCSEETRNVFNRVIKSVLRRSFDAFPNITEISIDLPYTQSFYESSFRLIRNNNNLRNRFSLKVVNDQRKIQTRKHVEPQSVISLPFDPYAHIPSDAQHNFLRMINTAFARTFTE